MIYILNTFLIWKKKEFVELGEFIPDELVQEIKVHYLLNNLSQIFLSTKAVLQNCPQIAITLLSKKKYIYFYILFYAILCDQKLGITIFRENEPECETKFLK